MSATLLHSCAITDSLRLCFCFRTSDNKQRVVKKSFEPDKGLNFGGERERWYSRLKIVIHLFHEFFQKIIVLNLSLKGKKVDLLTRKFPGDASFSVDTFSTFSIDLWHSSSFISTLDSVFSESQMSPIFTELLLCKYLSTLSARRHLPRPNWTRHIGHRSVFGRHFWQMIWPFTHW